MLDVRDALLQPCDAIIIIIIIIIIQVCGLWIQRQNCQRLAVGFSSQNEQYARQTFGRCKSSSAPLRRDSPNGDGKRDPTVNANKWPVTTPPNHFVFR